MYEQISADTLKELFKIWKVKNIEELENKTSNISIVSFKFYELSIECKNIIYHLVKNCDKELSSIDVAYSLHYNPKHLPAFLDIVEEIKESGFLYVKMRRRRLNSGDDILYLIPKVKEIIENIILEELKIKNFIDIQYNSNIYKKYLKDIISIHESGGIFEKNKLNIEDEDLLALCKANIFCVYFYGENFKTYIGINNNQVIEKIEKSYDENIPSSVFIYNHFNILNDIETLIYEADMQKLNVYDINIKFLSENIDSKTIINICYKSNLIKIDNKGFIFLEYDNIKNYLAQDIETRIDFILKNSYKNYLPYNEKILKILKDEDIISKSKLFLKLKEKYNIILNSEEFNNILYSMFLLGFLEASFYESAIISLRNLYYSDSSVKKCFVNGNFEITLINHNLFSNDFIYMCNLYFELDNNETVYTYSMTEDKILKGKTIINNPDSKYSFYNFLNILKNTFEKNSINIPKHIETNLKRWYERGIISSIYENVTLINIKNQNKLEEIICEAKRKGINIIKINEEFAIVKSTSINNKSLIKFLRQRKIIINF